MGKEHCICGEEPCVCHNGWGRYETEHELLAAIEDEIRSGPRRGAWNNGDADCQTVQWMRGENMSVDEISEVLGISTGRVRGICRRLGIQ